MVSKKETLSSNAPEGGWGWYVVLAFALNNMVVIPTVQLFGLLYKDLLANLEMTAVEINSIIAINCSFGMLLAIFNGPVLRRFGFRKIAVFGVILIFIGNLLTSQSSSFWHFLLFFSIVVSVGMNFAMAAFHLALNTYFVVKRGVATGVAMSITGLGPIIMPLVVSGLMDEYGVRGSGILLAGIALHSLIGACLLQPVKWHTKKMRCKKPDPKKVEEIELGMNNVYSLNNTAKVEVQNSDRKTEAEDEATPSTKLMASVEDSDSKSAPIEKPTKDDTWKLPPIVSDVAPSVMIAAETAVDELKLSTAQQSMPDDDETKAKLFPTLSEATSENDEIMKKAKNEDRRPSSTPNKEQKPSEVEDEATPSTKLIDSVDFTVLKTKSEDKSKSNDDESGVPPRSLDDVVRRHDGTVLERIVKFFDFDLLCDPVYVNISLGLSIVFVSEMNFAMMLPFILEDKDRSFNTNRIAVMLSVMAGADIVSRFISPFFGQSVKSKVRVVYLVSLLSGIICRIAFLYSYSYLSTMCVIFALGVTKGIRTVYTTLVIPTYVPLPKLASATGLQMVNNGLLFIVFGPMMGVIRQNSKDYTIWIHVINCFTACTIFMWFTELYLLRSRKKQKKPPIVIKNEQ